MPPERPGLISIVATTLNEVKAVERLAKSVYMQNYRPLELIVVDGDSRDGTVEKVTKLTRELMDESFSIRLLRESDFGSQRSTGNAKRIGVKVSQGGKVIFMDPDMSFLSKDSIDLISRKLEQVPFTKVRTTIIIDTDLERLRARGYPRFHHCAYCRAVLEKVEFDSSLGFGEDQDFWLRVKRDLGLNMDETCDATIARHLPHTKSEYLRQSSWYADTLPQFAYVVVKRREYELMSVLCDWLHYWSYCFLPMLAIMFSIIDYARRDRTSPVKFSLLLWDSIVRRYVSFCHFLRSAARKRLLQLNLRLFLTCVRSRHGGLGRVK